MKRYLFIFFLFLIFFINGFGQNSDRAQSIQNDFQNYVNAESAKNYTGSFLPVFTNKENTVGHRYLFNRWVKGKIVNTNNEVISDDSYVFNYDKISSVLLATQDNKIVLEVNDSDVQSFTLTYDGVNTVFERVPLISSQNFFLPLVESEKGYTLYKLIKTRFEKANFSTNGIFSSGKNYDEYIDEPEYYVIYPSSKEFKKLELKRKSVKETLSSEIAKIRTYFSEHNGESFDENYLAGLVNFLNQ